MENTKMDISFQLLKGLGIAFLATLIGIFIFSLLLMYTGIPESSIPIVIIVISFISILMGAMISTRKISQRGMIHGGMIGRSLYCFIIPYFKYCKYRIFCKYLYSYDDDCWNCCWNCGRNFGD